MKNFQLLSAILSQQWLIAPDQEARYFPLLEALLTGKLSVEDGESEGSEETLLNWSWNGLPAEDIDTYHYQKEVSQEDHIAVIQLHRPLVKADTWCDTGMLTRAEQLKGLGQNPKVKGVFFSYDSPGGQAQGTSYFAETIRSLNIPTVAWTRYGMACSAAYWSASASNELICGSADDCVGSIGAYATFYDYASRLKDEGILHEIYSSFSTEKNKEFLELREGKYKSYQERFLDPMVKSFHAAVKGYRPNLDEKVLKGATYRAEEAMSLGLIDHIGDRDFALQRLGNLIEQSEQAHQSTTSNQSINMNFFGSKLTAALNTLVKEPNEQQLTAFNALLEEQGSELVMVTGTQLNELDQGKSDLQDQVTKLTAELATAQQEAKDWKEKAEAYGAQPATLPSQVQSNNETPDQDEEAEDNPTKTILALDHYKDFNSNPLFNS